MLVYCEWTPRGKSGTPFCAPLTFTGEVIGRSIKEGCYNVKDQTTTYCVPLYEMNEVETNER